MGGASFLFTLGSVVMGCAPDVTTLILGRFIVGLAIGVAAIVSPVYLAGTSHCTRHDTRTHATDSSPEISPTRYRGAVVTVNNLCLTGGQFVSYLVDSAFVSVPGGTHHHYYLF
jgi:SP family myo-inositol transporter-like MFS transporter 13